MVACSNHRATPLVLKYHNKDLCPKLRALDINSVTRQLGTPLGRCLSKCHFNSDCWYGTPLRECTSA